MAAWLVVGLGNPGPAYASHRHNVGFRVVDELARRARGRFSVTRGLRADVCETRLAAAGMGVPGPQAQRVILLKPRTFMNGSGGAVAAAVRYYRVPLSAVVVVHDELDLEFGQLRLKTGGGDNGHNGLKSLRAALGSGDVHRLRFGVGRPPGRQEPADFLLTPFPAAVRDELTVEIGRAADAVEALISDGLTAAQNRFNS